MTIIHIANSEVISDDGSAFKAQNNEPIESTAIENQNNTDSTTNEEQMCDNFGSADADQPNASYDFHDEDIVELTVHKVQCTMRVARMKDGSEVVRQDVVRINGERYILVPLLAYTEHLEKYSGEFLSDPNQATKVAFLDFDK